MIPNAAGLIVSDSAAVVEAEALSVSLTVKLAAPAAPGVPDIAPPGDRFNPAGNDPLDTVQEYGGVPPVALSVCEYGAPAVPAGSDDVVISNVAGAIVSDKGAVALFAALSLTFTVKLDDPAAPGVPDIAPPADRVNPAGNDPLDKVHEYGGVPPVAARLCE